MMKKMISLLLALMMMLAAFPSLAEAASKSTVALPFGVSFGMNMDELNKMLGKDAQRDVWFEDDPDAGTVMLEACDLGFGGLKADGVYFQVDRNNSAKEPRLSMISANLAIGDNVISSFRSALSALTEAYGAPDSDPFDEASVESYVEYGSLSTTWTTDDMRINISVNRMYDESLNMDFTYRLNYDASDLK